MYACVWYACARSGLPVRFYVGALAIILNPTIAPKHILRPSLTLKRSNPVPNDPYLTLIANSNDGPEH